MTDVQHQTTRELIEEIEKKNKRFRFAEMLFIVMTFLGLITVIVIQQRTLDTSRATLVAVQAQLKQQDQSVNQINRHIDCVLVFFSQRDRANLSIEDVNKCTLSNGTSATQYFQTKSGQPEVVTP